jgi:serine/threonine-protein kinase
VPEPVFTNSHSASATYKVLRKLGKGGMAEVFLARQEGMAGVRRLTVIKRLLPQFSQVSDVAEMLLDEARIAAQLTHPNIVQIYELGKDEGQYFIAMEFVDGCDLATLARIERHRQSRLPLRLSLRVVSEAAMGLDYAHRQMGLDGRPLNIVHRDVSPQNIMCSREGAVKVADFGIAKAAGKVQVTQVGVVKGKVQYMSPEQYTGAPVDHRSDIFSLGVVLYQLTTGRLPRVSERGEIVMRRVLEGSIPKPSEIRSDYPDELEAIVMRALAQNPDERYADAASFRDDLLDFSRENDLLAFPKELGEYVNALVPPTPLVIREQSVLQEEVPAEEPGAPSSGPSVVADGDDQDTEAPSGTEVASPGGRRKNPAAVGDARSEPFAQTELSSQLPESSAALLPDESLAPIEAVSQKRATPWGVSERGGASVREQRAREERSHRAALPPEQAEPLQRPPGKQPEVTPPTPLSTPVTPVTPSIRSDRSFNWSAVAALAALAAAGVTIYVLRFRAPPVPPTNDPAATSPVGAGVISIMSNPANASVSVDGAQRCPSTPCQIAGLPLNRELLITLRAPSHTLWMQRLVLTASDPKLLLRADLAPELPAQVAPRPADAQASPGTGPDKTSAAKKVRAGTKRAPGHKKEAAKKTPGSKGGGKVVVVPIDEDVALLAVDAQPWAEVWVNGQKAGHTPLQIPVKPGACTVELKNPGLKFSKAYRIKAANKKKVKIFEQLPAPEGAPGG